MGRNNLSATKLDSVDKKILTYLQESGRITNVELADRVGITAPPCLRRVRALEEAGYIKGYYADLNKAALGFTITVFVMVGLNSQSETDLKNFESMVAALPLVRECYMLNGEYDFLLKIVACDLSEFQNFLTSEILPGAHVETVKTSLTIRSAKQEPGIPMSVVNI